MKAIRPPCILMALPLAYQDAIDKYVGFMRYVTTRRLNWELKIVRERIWLDVLKTSGADAFAVCGIMAENHLGLLPADRRPLVLFDIGDKHRFRRRPNTVFIDIDSQAVTRSAFSFLTQDGAYDSYGFVGFAIRRHWSEVRRRCFDKLLRARGLVGRQFVPDARRPRADALLAWLLELPKPAAVYADCDMTAAEVLAACSAGNLRVPEEVAVIGVDNEVVTCTHTRPSLTSVQPDFRQEGYLAAQAIDRMLHNRKTPSRIVCARASVVERSSTGAASPAGRLVRRADELIARDFAGGLKAADLPRLLKVSRRLLDLRYRQIKGQSPLEAILALRIERMKSLLKESSVSIEEVAASSGFSSVANARRAFRRHVGTTMRAYRRSSS